MRSLTLAILGIASIASAEPRARVTPDLRDAGPPTGSVCSSGEMRCLAHVVIDDQGAIAPLSSHGGLTPTDIRSAYRINPNISTHPTVAIVLAYGYSAIEQDLATYRNAYSLAPCTRANGCLEVINQRGATSPLPADPPADNDWTLEGALDIDAVSAACPRCKILVVLSDSSSSADMFAAQAMAASRKPAAISDSWGAVEHPDAMLTERFFDHPGVGQFVASGDAGFNTDGRGPMYPSTSAHVIAVGGTRLDRAQNNRGWIETAWTRGGSSCSAAIPKPSYQPLSPCTKRVTTEVAAVGDPGTGLAVYNEANGGWLVLGGTSLSAPLVAAMFASAGHGAAMPADFSRGTDALFDVTSGTNGPCGSILCTAAAGWDGPTGYGTPDTATLAGIPFTSPDELRVSITSPGDGSTVQPELEIHVLATAATVVGATVDGEVIGKAMSAPYVFDAPRLAPGPHQIEVFAIDAAHQQVTSTVAIDVAHTDDGGFEVVGCSASGSGSPLILLALLALRRQRRSSSRGTLTVAPSST
jgi:hypothetical protein